ncbi:MAG: hypothetical protein HMLIMOIP_000240 [Candidatus Nitrosomirales archaeon]
MSASDNSSLASQPIKKSNKKYIGIGVGVAVTIAIILAPFIPVSSTEQYVEMQTKKQLVQEMHTKKQLVQEMQTQSQPYQDLETKNEALISGQDITIEPNTYYSWHAFIPTGRTVEFSVRASDTVNTYVLTSSEFTNFQSASNYNTVAQRLDTENARYGFNTAIADTYYFVVSNPHNGIFGIGSKTVGLYSATATATWQEMVTKYRNVQVPVMVEKEVREPVMVEKEVREPVTLSRQITKNLSVIQILMGNSNVQPVLGPSLQVGKAGLTTQTSATQNEIALIPYAVKNSYATPAQKQNTEPLSNQTSQQDSRNGRYSASVTTAPPHKGQAKLHGEPNFSPLSGLTFIVDVSEVKSDFEAALNSQEGYSFQSGQESYTGLGHTIKVSSWGFTFKSTDTNKIDFYVHGNDIVFDGSYKGNKTLHGGASYDPSTAFVKGNIGVLELLGKSFS